MATGQFIVFFGIWTFQQRKMFWYYGLICKRIKISGPGRLGRFSHRHWKIYALVVTSSGFMLHLMKNMLPVWKIPWYSPCDILFC